MRGHNAAARESRRRREDGRRALAWPGAIRAPRGWLNIDLAACIVAVNADIGGIDGFVDRPEPLFNVPGAERLREMPFRAGDLL